MILAIEANALGKSYGDIRAVDGLDLTIPRGQFFGLLGPNGSGKTTTVHMLSTLIRPTEGSASVAGHDVSIEPVAVRSRIGVVFQDPALDGTLSVDENLRFAGRLNHLPSAEIERRSAELLALFGIEDRRKYPVGALSGGQRRALDIARGLIHQPEILFLDEPTIGLDLPNRRRIWRHIGRLRAEHRITVFLTTHYLEEAADCDQVAFIRKGRIVRAGAPGTLLAHLGDWIIEVEGDDPGALEKLLVPRLGPCLIDGERLCFRHGQEDLAPIIALQQEFGPRIAGLRWRRPNLNDAFLWVHEKGLWEEAAS
jgi:ABC-2 type transport system ATP-binding protein